MYSISTVLPAFNEGKNIAGMIIDLISVLERLAPDHEIVVVDDGSRDPTAEVVRQMAREYPQVRLIQHERNQGYGAALYTGFTSARKDLIFMTDSDRQFVLNELEGFLPLLDEADMVIGYRPHRADPFHRRLYGWGWNMLVNLLFGYTARDVDCAFKLFRREIIDHIDIRSRGATFSAEFLVRAKRAGYRIRQHPVSHLPRLEGRQTGGRLDVIVRAFRELIRLRLQLWREKRSKARTAP